MSKKLLSILTFLFLVCGMNVSAQELQSLEYSPLKQMPQYSSNGMVTSNIQVKPNEYWWGYWEGTYDDQDFRLLGLGSETNVPQSYSQAICIPAGSVFGKDKTIEGAQFTFPSSENIGKVVMWISEDLPVNPYDATICYKFIEDVTGMQNLNDYLNEVRFDKPYKIDPSKNIYVGVSYVVEAISSVNNGQSERFPIIVKGKTTLPNAMFLKLGSSEWEDMTESTKGNLAFKVLLSADISDNAVNVSPTFTAVPSVKGTETIVPITVENFGNNGIESMEITVTVDGKKTQSVVKPETKIIGIGAPYVMNVKVPAISVTGKYNMEVSIDKVNGVENASTSKVTKGQLLNISRIIDRKVVFEEFTGMGCGWCPRGLVALEKAHEIYGKNIILISAHTDDAISCRDYTILKNSTTNGLPSSHLDRTYMGIDPYFGTSGGGSLFAIQKDIEKCAAVTPLAEVNVDAVIEGDNLIAKSDVKFLFTGSGDYAVAFVLTEDGMHNDRWGQMNNYSGLAGSGYAVVEETDPLFEKWLYGEKRIKGMTYDDVAIAGMGVLEGIDNSLPATFVEEESNKFEVTFNLDKLTKIQNRNNLNVCVFVYDRTTKKIVNAGQMSFEHETGIEGVEADDENVREVARYTIDGRRINEPQQGVNLVKYSDGKVKKVIVK